MFCDALKEAGEEGIICGDCRVTLNYIKGYEELPKTRNVDELHSLFSYKEPVREGILALKFNERPDKGHGFGILLSNYIRMNVAGYKEALVIDVPLGKKRKKERRYNQSTIIARRAAKSLHIRFIGNVVKRLHETKAQSSIGREERLHNLKGCFFVDKQEQIYGRTVILVDDVLTTGSTLEEMALELKNAGAKKVIGVTVAASVERQGGNV